MPKAIAIAVRQNPVVQTVQSVCDFMYGTPERTRFTLAFAGAMLVLGAGLSVADAYANTLTCGYDALAHHAL